MIRLWVLLIILLSFQVQAALPIPNGMTSLDRQNAVEVLGFGTSYKVLGNPYPLGGYSGYELGVSMEFLNTEEIARLGNKAGEQTTTSYFVLSLSKGLFYGVDITFQFSPLGQTERFSSFGGALRWGFAELSNQPVHFALQASANSASFQERINTTTQSLDLVTGYTRDAWSLYGGAGLIRTSGVFIGGPGGITSDQKTATESVASIQYFGGLSMNLDEYFLAIQANRVVENNYSVKLGVRY